MTVEDRLWTLEERFWTEGADFAKTHTAGGALMVFPYPTGILQGDQIVEGMANARRWRSVSLSDKTVRVGTETAVLAYRARAEREGEPIYEALCASTYVRDDGEWRLMAHQQTPA
jgi:hypothetical protein